MWKFGETLQAIVVFLVTAVTFGLLYITPDVRHDPTAFLILLIIFALIITDRLGQIFAAYLNDKDRAETQSQFRRTRDLVLSTRDLITFPDNSSGCEYCTYLAKTATHIRNTVLRYGNPNTPIQTAKGKKNAYDDWLRAKREAVARKVPFDEILSLHIAEGDPQLILLDQSPRNQYHPTIIDDRVVPMMQVAIFDFGSHAEVVFGWIFHRVEEGVCFASRDQELVKFFKAYFDHHFSIAKKL